MGISPAQILALHAPAFPHKPCQIYAALLRRKGTQNAAIMKHSIAHIIVNQYGELTMSFLDK